MSGNPFAPATKRSAKARITFDGPSGSGKTWTSLEWATVLAGPDGRIALVDTERGSASLYADRFSFDVIEVRPPYDPRRLIELVQQAEGAGYDVLVIDSLTHFWNGEGGTLDIVDEAATRTRGNTFAAWKEGTPIQRAMIDTLVGADLHVITTMRSKQEYVLEEGRNGKQIPRRVGMAPEQRTGMEYEFTLVGDIDLNHVTVFSKSRCDLLADAVVKPGDTQDAAERFQAWLFDGARVADRTDIDALVQAMKRLPDYLRKPTMDDFVARFGMPDRLIASELEAAREFVAEAQKRADDVAEAYLREMAGEAKDEDAEQQGLVP